MLNVTIINDVEFSATLPDCVADIHHERINGAHVYSYRDAAGASLRAVSESGGVFVVMTGDVRLSRSWNSGTSLTISGGPLKVEVLEITQYRHPDVVCRQDHF